MMGLQPDTVASRPAHVPADLAFDFDMYGVMEDFVDDPHAAWKQVQDKYPPIFWTPRYDGHWVVTRGEDIRHIQETHSEFSNRECFIPRGVIPRIIPVQLDPPEHGPLRRLFMPAFLPKALIDIEKRARAVAIEIIDTLAPKGECEFVRDFAGAMPIIAFLKMVDLPEQDSGYLRSLAVHMSKPNHPESAQAWADISAYISGWIEKRRVQPGEDLISRIVHAKVDDQPLADQDVFSICLLLLSGGLDTVVTMTSFIARFLATHPEERHRIRDNPSIIPNAIEEFARRFGTTQMAREIRYDMSYKGVPLKKGELIVIPTPLYGLDDRINDDPMKVDLDRKRPQHMAFGNGPHTCPGAVLARREMSIFLQEWLPRIPDFRLKPGHPPLVTTGLVSSMGELWLEWDV